MESIRWYVFPTPIDTSDPHTHVIVVAYAYDPLLIKVFLNYLTLHPHGQGHRADDGTRVMVANCSVVPNVFNRRSNVPGSMFSHITPAQALASVVSTAFSPENPESWQFYLLERDVNSARKLVSPSVSLAVHGEYMH